MTETRASIVAYVRGRAEKLRGKADSNEHGWETARHDATVLDTIASDIAAGLDEASE